MIGTTRSQLLNAIEAGDILYAIADNGDPKVVLVYRTDENTIFARLVTSQTRIEFTREGYSQFVDSDYTCRIASVAPLPTSEYGTLRGLERKLRLSHSLDQARLSEQEKDLLLGIVDFYKARPLPAD